MNGTIATAPSLYKFKFFGMVTAGTKGVSAMQPLFVEWQGEYIPRYYKDEVYKLAVPWFEKNKEWLAAHHGRGCLYLNVQTFDYIIGKDYDSCVRGYERFFGSFSTSPRHMFSVTI